MVFGGFSRRFRAVIYAMQRGDERQRRRSLRSTMIHAPKPAALAASSSSHQVVGFGQDAHAPRYRAMPLACTTQSPLGSALHKTLVDHAFRIHEYSTSSSARTSFHMVPRPQFYRAPYNATIKHYNLRRNPIPSPRIPSPQPVYSHPGTFRVVQHNGKRQSKAKQVRQSLSGYNHASPNAPNCHFRRSIRARAVPPIPQDPTLSHALRSVTLLQSGNFGRFAIAPAGLNVGMTGRFSTFRETHSVADDAADEPKDATAAEDRFRCPHGSNHRRLSYSVSFNKHLRYLAIHSLPSSSRSTN